MKQRKHLFDDAKNVIRLIRLLSAICALLFVLDFILHRHSSHPLESIPGFYPLFGFVGCVLLVLIAKWMRLFLKRPETYYHGKEKLEKQRHEKEKCKQANSSEAGCDHVDP